MESLGICGEGEDHILTVAEVGVQGASVQAKRGGEGRWNTRALYRLLLESDRPGLRIGKAHPVLRVRRVGVVFLFCHCRYGA